MEASDAVRLTSFASGGGCATKIAQADLAALLAHLPQPVDDPALLVGGGDDAAVYRLDQSLALVLTTDFFAPVVDDPDDYGAIAATNALSDVYAMGGRPLLALNLVAWPGEDVLPSTVLQQVLLAGAGVVRGAGALLVGGHSVRDAEPKYGLAVVGTVAPDRVMRQSAGRPGDVLVLTKALGTGVVCNAARLSEAPAEVVEAAVASMRRLNAAAAAAAAGAGVRCAVDITGFGLLGHTHMVALASGCGVEIDAGALPALPGVRELAGAGRVPGGSRRNLAYADSWTDWEGGVGEFDRVLATDAQTSGGLLLAVERGRAADLCRALTAGGDGAATVGRLADAPPGAVRVRSAGVSVS